MARQNSSKYQAEKFVFREGGVFYPGTLVNTMNTHRSSSKFLPTFKEHFFWEQHSMTIAIMMIMMKIVVMIVKVMITIILVITIQVFEPQQIFLC